MLLGREIVNVFWALRIIDDDLKTLRKARSLWERLAECLCGGGNEVECEKEARTAVIALLQARMEAPEWGDESTMPIALINRVGELIGISLPDPYDEEVDEEGKQMNDGEKGQMKKVAT